MQIALLATAVLRNYAFVPSFLLHEMYDTCHTWLAKLLAKTTRSDENMQEIQLNPPTKLHFTLQYNYICKRQKAKQP